MTHHTNRSLCLTLGLALLLTPLLGGPVTAPIASASTSHTATSHTAASPSAQRPAVMSSYGQLPLAFEVNAGQAAAPIRFLAHGQGYTLALTPTAALLALTQPTTTLAHPLLPGMPTAFARPSGPSQPSSALSMTWLGATPNLSVTGEQSLPGTVNYMLGNDPTQWHTHITTYQQVRYHNVYPGVDLVYYGTTGGQLEYDFVVAPGANPSAIHLGFTGANWLGVDLQGNLRLTLPGGTVAQQKPLVYQPVQGVRQVIAGDYTLAANQQVSFALGAYNPRLPLVIDPSYQFSTYLGGSLFDGANAVAVDSAGSAYVVGATSSTDFPTANPAQSVNAGGIEDAFVTKFNPAGSALIYSTYLGGNNDDRATAVALDSAGDAVVTGNTQSSNFPVLNAFQGALGGTGATNAFVTKLTADGTGLWYSTYLGGNNADDSIGIAVDSAGNAYVTGYTYSTNFPTHNPLQGTLHGHDDAFVSKLNATGNGLVYSTYLGGTAIDQASAIALDSADDAYITGYTFSGDFPTTAGAFQRSLATSAFGNAFVSKLNASGSALTYSTYLGGNNSGGCICPDQGVGIAVDASGDAYVTGSTDSPNFPVTAGAFQTVYTTGSSVMNHAFVTKFNTSGSGLVYSTFLEGSATDTTTALAVDGAGNAYVTGTTTSAAFPTVNPLQAAIGDQYGSSFVSQVNASGTSLLYSSYLGGSNGASGDGIALDQGRDVYVVGYTISTDFPTKNALQPTRGGTSTGDAFVTKLRLWPSVDTTTGVFRPSNGVLYLKNSNTTGPADLALHYGKPGDQPITGDWTGKGYRSIGVFRNGVFYLRNTNTTGIADLTVYFGASGDLPVVGDWTGKGYDSVGIFRNGVFYLRNTNTGGLPDSTIYFGTAGDLPVVGDWTGKGYDSIGVYRPSTGTFYLRNSNTSGAPDITVTFGASGDLPIAGDWTTKGYDSIGVYRSGTYFLRNSNTTGAPDISFTLGVAGDQPIAGPWLAPSGSLPPVHRKPSTTASGQHAAATPTRRGPRLG